MATSTKASAAAGKNKNIYQKLAQARLDFLTKNVQKSGVNPSGEYEYFELKDIVPLATEILNTNGLLFVITFPMGVPTGTLYDFDSDQTIVFNCEKVEGDITGIKGGKMMISIQSEGAKQTYHRRYLWMQLLDVVEHDAIENKEYETESDGKSKKATTTSASSKKPVSEEKRAEIKKEITDSEGAAEEIQIEQLKKALKALNDETNGEYEEFIAEIAIKTENFTNLSKKNCEALIIQIGELIDEYKKGVVE